MPAAQEAIYAKLLLAGATPNYALSVARSAGPRAVSILNHLTAGQIFQILGLNLSADQLVQQLEYSTAGSILGSIIGSIFGSAEGPPGAFIGGIAGAAAGQAAAQAYRADTLSRGSSPTVRQGPARRAFRQQPQRAQHATGFDIDDIIDAIPKGFQFGVKLANKLGPLLFPATQPPVVEAPPAGYPAYQDANPQQPPPQVPYYANPSTEILPQVYQPSEGPETEANQDNRYPEPQPYCPAGAPCSYAVVPQYQGQPSERPSGTGPGPQPQPCATCDEIANLRAQTQQEIQTEQRQLQHEQQNQNRQQQRQIENRLRDLEQTLDNLRQLERQPADQRNIPQELQAKQQIQHELDRLEPEARQLALQRPPRQPGQPIEPGDVATCYESDDLQNAFEAGAAAGAAGSHEFTADFQDWYKNYDAGA